MTTKRRRGKNICYAEKYDPNCVAMKQVFDFIYDNLVSENGISSNMVAVSGESIGRYVRNYIPKVIGNRCKAVIMENNLARVKRLKKKLKANSSTTSKKTKIVYGNIITYQDNLIVKKFIKTPARFLDLGLGIGITALTKMAKLMLFEQQKVRKYKLKKTIILDAARRAVPDQEQVRLLNDFLAEVEQKIETINGIDVSENSQFMLGTYEGPNILAIGHPFNASKERKGQPQRHVVTLSGNKMRSASLTLFTYRNGNYMLTAVLQYK